MNTKTDQYFHMFTPFKKEMLRLSQGLSWHNLFCYCCFQIIVYLLQEGNRYVQLLLNPIYYSAPPYQSMGGMEPLLHCYMCNRGKEMDRP